MTACGDSASSATSFGESDSATTSGGGTTSSDDGTTGVSTDDGSTTDATATGGNDDTGTTGGDTTGGDDGGIEGEACMEMQNGLCEDPGAMAYCYGGAMGTCDVGACAGGVQTCEGIDLDLGEWGACEGEVLPSVEACDGEDNDCDGETDEELGETVCGLGVCQHSEENCIDGRPNACDPMLGAEDEVCDGEDNDCDGDIDEELGDDVVSCGVGQCEHSVTACQGGAMPECDPFEGATAEACDGEDNDCDGDTDEGLGNLMCGVGECAHTEPACMGGQPQTCDPFEGSMPEDCDGLDNDCDGQADEGFGSYTCGEGECEHTVQECVNGQPGVCDAYQGATTEVCDDGLDNDCDGEVDEDCGVCGDGFVDMGEQCDGNDLGGEDCFTLGYDGGTLDCNPNCTHDSSGCFNCFADGFGFTSQDNTAAPGCNNPIASLTCSSTYNGQVLEGEGNIDGPYTCGEPYSPLDQPENEDVYEFTCQADGDVELQLTNMDCDLDIYILDSSCDADGGCVGGSTNANTTNDSVTFSCIAGQTYYIVIEGWGWQNVFPPSGQCGPGEGNYTMHFETGQLTGGCLEDCDDGIDNDQDGPVDCDDSDCTDDPVCQPCP